VEHKKLSERESEVLALIAQGLTNIEIGEKLYITANTVEQHLKSIRRKTDAGNRVKMALWYIRREGFEDSYCPYCGSDIRDRIRGGTR